MVCSSCTDWLCQLDSNANGNETRHGHMMLETGLKQSMSETWTARRPPCNWVSSDNSGSDVSKGHNQLISPIINGYLNIPVVCVYFSEPDLVWMNSGANGFGKVLLLIIKSSIGLHGWRDDWKENRFTFSTLGFLPNEQTGFIFDLISHGLWKFQFSW